MRGKSEYACRLPLELDLSLEVSRIFTAWKARYFDREKQRSKNSLDIFGERGCGKTAAAQAYVRAHKTKARYFSFVDLDGAAALTAFAATFQLENKNPASWDEAGQLYTCHLV